MNKKVKKFNDNMERIFLLVSIVLLIIMLSLTVLNFIFFPALVNIFAIMLFAICNIMMREKSMKLYVDILYVKGDISQKSFLAILLPLCILCLYITICSQFSQQL